MGLSLKLGLGLEPSGGSGQIALPVTFDGTNAYLTRTSDLSGNADTQLVSAFFDFTSTTNDGTIFEGQTSGNERVRFFLTPNRVYFLFRSTVPTVIQQSRNADSGLPSGVRSRWWVSCNTSTGAYNFYGVRMDTEAVITSGSHVSLSGTGTGTIDFTLPDWSIGGRPDGANKMTGTIRRVAVWNDVAPDVTSSSVRDQMADTAQASDVGNNIVDFYGGASAWNAGTNQGSGGDFTMNGSVT